MNNLNFCIVGCGNHAQKRIIPALKNINAKKINAVSSQSIKLPIHKQFSKLNEALIAVEKETVFIICSPPHLHFSQAKKIINSGYHLFIEKPITTKLNHLKKIISLSNSNNAFFVENLMHKYSNFYDTFINFWKKNKGNIKKIKISFIIPSIPEKSFRTKSNEFPVNIYDIGCYIVSLINDLEAAPKIRIENIINKKDIDKEIIEARSEVNSVEVKTTFGFGNVYNNSVIIEKTDGEEFKFEPFFYGLDGERKIICSTKKNHKSKKFYDDNCFEIMFSKENNYWFESQNIRNNEMIKNLTLLENLHKQYNDYK